MSEIQRYDHYIAHASSGDPESLMGEAQSGDWVKFEDYAEEKHRADQNAAYLETLTERMLAAEKENAALQQKLDAVLAENVALKSNLMYWDAEDPETPYDCPEDIANNFAMELNAEFDVQVAAKMPNRTYRVSKVGGYDCEIEIVSGGMLETPATDAILNEVRAEGVGMFASAIQGGCAVGDRVKDLADNFAAQLRTGSTEGGV